MGWTRFFRRAHWDRERWDEIESYLQLETDENMARGLSREDAVAAARKKFGNPTGIREEIYRMNTVSFADSLGQDVRHGLRALRNNPAFTVATLLTLVLGIGANTAVFSVVNSVLFKPLAYPNADQLVALHQIAPGAAGLATFSDGLRLSPSLYFTYAEHNRTFQSLGVWSTGTANVTGIAEPEQVSTVSVSSGVLETLNVPPAAGRWLSAVDQVPLSRAPGAFSGASTAVMLSYGYWQRRFGGDRSAIGRGIIVDSQPREIVGVMPPEFRIVNAAFDVMLPQAFDRGALILAGFGYQGIGRLKPGVTLAQANADLARLLPVWMDSWSNGPGTNPKSYERWRITPSLRPLKQEVVGDAAEVLWAILATIGLVLVIVCANVTNLFLVRTETRQQELAMRTALGGSRGRIVQTLLIESTMLGLMGGFFGVGLAYAGLRLLVRIGPVNLPRLNEIAIDPRAIGFTFLLSLLAGFFSGLIPALKYAGPQIADSFRSSARTFSMSRDRHRVRNLLVVAQVAIALVLLVSAGLMIRTFQALRTIEPGFQDPRHLQIFRIAIPASLLNDPERVTRTENAIQEKLAAIPGVSAAGIGSQMPMEGFSSFWDVIMAEDKTYPAGEIPPLRWYKYVSPEFFRAAGTRIVAGRELTWSDVYDRRHVILVSENLARELWGAPSGALGKHLREFQGMPWREVVGVVQDVREDSIGAKPPAIVYWPLLNEAIGPFPARATRAATFVVRSDRAGTELFLDQVRQAVWSVNASLPVASLRSMQDVYGQSLARTSFTLVMLAIAGGMALILGFVGVYGTISYSVSQRRREIGIRAALGAKPGELQRMFIAYGLTLAGIGIAIGFSAALGLTKLMRSLLFGITPLDPITYAAVLAVLLTAASAASYLPARKAASVDPSEALRAE